MWPNNGYQGHGDFQQGNIQQNYSDDGYIPFSPVAFGQQYFQNIRPSQGMQYNDLASSEQSTPGEFQPEIGLYNEEAFAQNQFRSSVGPEEYISQRQGIPAQGTPRPTLNARAEELKAQLLKNKDRAKSGTPPVTTAMVGSKPPNITDVGKSIRESPKISATPIDEPPALSRRTSAVIDDDLNDLISEAKAAANVKKENGSSPTKSHHSPIIESSQKSQIHNVEPSPKFTAPITNDANSHEKLTGKLLSRNGSNGDLSPVSEGEIHEDSRTKNKIYQPATGPKQTQSATKSYINEEQVPRKLRDEQNRKAVGSHDFRAISPQRDIPVSKARSTSSRFVDERHEEADDRSERRAHQPSDQYERKQQPESDQRSYQRRETRDISDDQRKNEIQYESRKEDATSRMVEVPSLAQLLLVDEDLKDWLVVTGYHNAEYRNKILNRRRAIAALDAQKAKLLEEMEIEERGGVPPVSNTQSSVPGMLPPPIPSKMGAAASSVKRADDIPIRANNEPISSTSSNQEFGVKRTYTEYRGSQDEIDVEKVARVDEKGRGIRVKSDSQSDDRRPYSSGPDASRRRSMSDDSKSLRRDERDSYDEDRGRDRGRSYSHQRDLSPAEDGYDGRNPAKAKKYNFSASDDRDDRSDWKNRPFVTRGNYRGRAYDPNYRGRGRGRGNWNELGEGRFERREPQPPQPNAQRLAYMKPYKDPKTLDLGRRGDTRYFIVKSFNEENVVRCIEDSIWTTQIENGEIFKQAFLKCKNVILIFSVNQSRAFQGYARMENIPGSEEAPQWQNNINWESAGAFRVRWVCVANTRFHRVGHIKNKFNENQPVLVGRDGQEIEEYAGEELLKLIDEEAERLLIRNSKEPVPTLWND